jgi:molecular chaperone DnaK
MVQQLLKDYFDRKEPNNGVNPDEEVAYGTDVQGSILTGEAFEKIIDITFHFLLGCKQLCYVRK